MASLKLITNLKLIDGSARTTVPTPEELPLGYMCFGIVNGRASIWGNYDGSVHDLVEEGGNLNLENGTGDVLVQTIDTNHSFKVMTDGRAKVQTAPKDNDDVVRKSELDTKLDKAGGTINGSLIIANDLTVQGKTTSVDTQSLKVVDKLIYVARDNATALTSPAGLITPKYDGTNNGGIVYDGTGTAYVGDIALDSNGNVDVNSSDLQPIATRDATIADGNIVKWNNTNLTLVDTGINVDNVAKKTELDNKVDKITGKGLSTNDFTNAEKTKLAGIEAEAQVNVIETITAGDNIAVSKIGKTVIISSTSGVDVVQMTGQSTTAVMSQKAVTDELNDRIITGAGAPTTLTVGIVGLIYEDRTNGKLYQCYAVNGSSYIWVKLKQSTWNLIGEYEVKETGIAQWEIQNIGDIIKNFDDINIEIYTPKNTNVSSNLQLSAKFGTNTSYPEAGYLYLAQSSAIGAIPYNYNIYSVLKIKKSGSIITSTLNTNNYGSTSYPSQVYGTVNGKYNYTDLTRLSISTYGDKYTEFPIGTKIKVYWR